MTGETSASTAEAGRSRYLRAVETGRPEASYPDIYGPPFRDAEVGAVLVTRYADAVQVLSDPVTFSNKATLFPVRFMPTGEAMAALGELLAADPPSLVTRDGDGHRAERAQTVRAFPKNATHVAPFMSDLLDGLVAALRQQATQVPDGPGEVDLMEQFARPLAAEVLRRTVGLSEEAAADIMASAAGQFEMIWGNPDPADQTPYAEDTIAIWRRCVEAVESWAAVDPAERPDNYITRILNQGLSLDDVKGNIYTVVSASHTTTAYALGNIVEDALGREGVWRTLHEQPSTVSGFVAERLAGTTSTQGWLRQVSDDVDVEGAVVADVRLEPGERVLVLLGAANLDPERPDGSADLTFSTGPHRCVGASQAKFLLEQALGRLAAEFPGLALSRPPQRFANIAFNGPEKLWVTLEQEPAGQPTGG